MPRISLRLLRLSLVALLAGAAVGGVLLGAEPLPSAWLPRLRGAHVQLMMFGWLLPFVLGTAYWMLPKHAAGSGRGSEHVANAGTALLQAGVALSASGELAAVPALYRLGGVFTLAGAAVFLRLLWPRVKPFGAGRAPAGGP